VITLADAVAAVTLASTGARGKDFLGYTASPHLESVLHSGLARLATEGIVSELGGARFAHDPTTLPATLAQLRTQAVAQDEPTDGPETMS
jgi:hypothetical protein